MYGVKAPVFRAALRPLFSTFKRDSKSYHDVIAAVDALWSLPEREPQLVALDLLRATQPVWAPLPGYPPEASAATRAAAHSCLVRCVRQRPWWDTVDVLAVHGFGTLWQAGERGDVTDALLHAWVDAECVWERRVAVLFQLRFAEQTDEERLFDTVRRRAGDEEFWIRKALGWALRTYRRTAPEAVDALLREEEGRLSALTLREARK